MLLPIYQIYQTICCNGMGQNLSSVPKPSGEKKKNCRKIGSSLGQLLAQELTSVVEVQHNFLDVILKLLIHRFIPPEKCFSSQAAFYQQLFVIVFHFRAAQGRPLK